MLKRYSIRETPLGAGLFCHRRRCQQLQSCRYAYDCKAKTREQAEALDTEWEDEQTRRAVVAQQAEHEAQRLRDDRRSRLETMLEAHGLSIDDLEWFIKEVTER
jgi:hypothetical protein